MAIPPDHTLRIDPLVYSTFLGGNDLEWCSGLVVTELGEAIIAGYTLSPNYPITPGVLDSTYAAEDCIITKLNAQGTALVYSTFLGGAQGDEGEAICLDGFGGVIVAGNMYSTDFPTTNGSGFNGGNQDCFITRLNSAGNAMIFSTTLGGISEDYMTAIVNDGSGGCYVTGYTESPNFPTSVGAYSRTLHGTRDSYISHINSNATQLLAGTLIGGSTNMDILYDIILCESRIIVAGFTTSTDYPITHFAFDTSYNVGGSDCIITKLDTSLSGLLYSTFIGGSGSDAGLCLVNSLNGSVIVAGSSNSIDFPTTPGAYQTSSNGSNLGFICCLDSSGSHLNFSSHLGDSSSSSVETITRDSDGDYTRCRHNRD